MAHTIGIDFGTNSVRALVVDCADGSEIASHVVDYPSGEHGIIVDPADHNLARQNPADYLHGLEAAVTHAIAAAKDTPGFAPEKVIGLGVDATASTPMPVDAEGTPLALHDKWKDDHAAHAWLWKDHTSAEEAARITATAAEHRPQYLAKCGSTYSSEWLWSKIWHCLNVAPGVFEAAHSWVELPDYIPAVLAGTTKPDAIVRGVCAAGHKGLYAEDWGGLPDKEFLALLDPRLADLRDRMFEKAHDSNTIAGKLSADWAQKLGLPEGIPIAVGLIDAHCGAVGAGVREGTLIKIIGTSTCDCTVAPLSAQLPDIPGICGIVNGSILPDHYGLEAGQSAVGDIFNWFVSSVCDGDDSLHGRLTNDAAKLKPGQSGLLALDWNNGNRNVLIDPRLTGLLLGQTLHTKQPEIYRALIEATAFGARTILDRFKEYGVPVERIVCCGGIAEKNPMLMQIYADVTNCTMQLSRSSQTCALGAALAASVAAGDKAGGHANFADALDAMTGVTKIQYEPDPASHNVYNDLHGLYTQVHDAFGGVNASADLGNVMKELLSIKERQAA